MSKIKVKSVDQISRKTVSYQYMEWYKENDIHNIYIWPDGDTPKRIYEEGGFRIIETRKAGRAVFEAD